MMWRNQPVLEALTASATTLTSFGEPLIVEPPQPHWPLPPRREFKALRWPISTSRTE
jgi:hypothetical protein